jgi:hypothetical protein
MELRIASNNLIMIRIVVDEKFFKVGVERSLVLKINLDRQACIKKIKTTYGLRRDLVRPRNNGKGSEKW